MDNRFTAGTEGVPQNNIKKSMVELPINEDWACLFIVMEKKLDDLMSCFKLWDESIPQKIFYIYFIGNMPEVGSIIVAYKMTEEIWFFLGFIPNNFVKDKGNGTGVACKFNADKSVTEFGEIKNITTVDPIVQYHNGNPPYKEGRIYFAQNSSDGWLVWLPGFGDEAYTPEVGIDATTKVKLHCDNQGNVLDLTVEGEPIQDDFWVKNLALWWRDKMTANDYEEAWRIFSDTNGEALGLDVDRIEIEVWDLGFKNKFTTLIKSSKVDFGADDPQQHPTKYGLSSYSLPLGSVYPSSFYSEFYSYTPEPPSDIKEMPGAGVYPPAGQPPNQMIQYKIIEFLADGSTRTTQKDEQASLLYEYDNSSATHPHVTPFHVPYNPPNEGINKNNIYFWLGDWDTKFDPTLEGQQQWKGYIYREDVAGEWYLHGTIRQDAIFGDANRVYFKRSRTYWGIPYDPTPYPGGYYKINKLYLVTTYFGKEIWVGPIEWQQITKIIKD